MGASLSQAALYLSLLVVIGCASPNRAISAHSLRSDSFKTCSQDETRQKERSVELQKIVAADQKDREDFQHWTPTQAMEVRRVILNEEKESVKFLGKAALSLLPIFRRQLLSTSMEILLIISTKHLSGQREL